MVNKRLSINRVGAKIYLALMLIFSSFFVLLAQPINASSFVALTCPNFSVERIVNSTTFDLKGCYSTFDEALGVMNAEAQVSPNVVIRHPSSLSPMKIVAMDRGIAINVRVRKDSSEPSTTNIYATKDYTNTSNRTYVNLNHTFAYFGTEYYGAVAMYNVGIAGYKGYVKNNNMDLVPMAYVENAWPILLGGDGEGNGVFANIIKPNYYEVTPGTPNEMNYYYYKANTSATGNANPQTITYTTDAYVYFGVGSSTGSPWYTVLSSDGETSTYRSTFDSIIIRKGPGTNYDSTGDFIESGYTFVGTTAAQGQWIKISSVTIPVADPEIKSVYRYSYQNYGAAPSWLVPGIKYYSYDGIHFYTDLDMKKPVNNGAAYYNYFQYLPARSESSHTAAEFNDYIVKQGLTDPNVSRLVGLGDAFVSGQNNYYMNASLIYAMAIHESGWGKSAIALSKNNLFGWGAVDSNAFFSAYTYESPTHSVHDQMSKQLAGYLNITDWRFAGNGLGQKLSGFNKAYASDPYWGVAIAKHIYTFDKVYGSVDFKKYLLGKINDYTALNVRVAPNVTAAVIYTTKSTHTDQMVIIEDDIANDGWYRIILQNNGPGKQYGYVSSDYVTPITIDTINGTSASIPTILGAGAVDNILHGFNLTSPISSIKSTILAQDSTASITVTDVNGTVKDDASNLTTGDNLNVTLTGGAPQSFKIAVKGDINGDGLIRTQDYVAIRRHILGLENLSGVGLVAADISNDSLIKTQDYVAVRRHILGLESLY